MPSCYAYLSNMIGFMMAEKSNKSPQCIITNGCLNRRIGMQFLFGEAFQPVNNFFGKIFPARDKVIHGRIIQVILYFLSAFKKFRIRLSVGQSKHCAEHIAGGYKVAGNPCYMIGAAAKMSFGMLFGNISCYIAKKTRLHLKSLNYRL